MNVFLTYISYLFSASGHILLAHKSELYCEAKSMKRCDILYNGADSGMKGLTADRQGIGDPTHYACEQHRYNDSSLRSYLQ